jgi:hypothetical protein
MISVFKIDRFLSCVADPDPSIIDQINKKTLILTVLRLLYDFLSLKNNVNIPSKSKKERNFVVKFLKVITGSGSVNQRCGSSDPYINVMDPQHWFYVKAILSN